MQKLIILNSREIRKIKELLIEDFGYFPSGEFALLESENHRIFFVNRDIAKIELENLRIDKVGLYFGELRETQFRLSKEGAQFLAHCAKEDKKKLINYVELTKEEVKKYFLGVDLERDLGPKSNLIILHHDDLILGCAQYKERKILNFLPKTNRGEVIV